MRLEYNLFGLVNPLDTLMGECFHEYITGTYQRMLSKLMKCCLIIETFRNYSLKLPMHSLISFQLYNNTLGNS